MRQRNLDELARMSDDDIRNLLKSSKDEILRLEKGMYRPEGSSRNDRLKLIQVEYCYIKREFEIRKDRHAAHRQFLEKTMTNNRRRAF